MKDKRIADLEGAYLGALGAVRETLGARSSLNIERAQRAQVNCDEALRKLIRGYHGNPQQDSLAKAQRAYYEKHPEAGEVPSLR
jgi:hypothetical protein